KNQALIGTPENEPALKVTFDIVIAGLPLTLVRGLTYKSTDPVKGEIYRPFEVIPPVTVNFNEKVFIAFDQKPIPIRCQIKSNIPEIKGQLQLNAPQGWKISIPNPEFQIKGKGNETYIDAELLNTSPTNGKITATIQSEGINYTKGISRVEYDHIPYQFILNEAEAQLTAVDLKKTGNTIGFIPGSGDETMTCLKQMGYAVTLLTDELLKNEDLTKYDAIVSGVRAYNTNERLQVYHEKLMNYVKTGGNLVVQYNTNNRIGPLLAKIGPYPFTISRDRVTNEKAEVRFLLPQHPVLHFPNEISATDFENWVQERGIYFATDLDPNYEKPLSMNDPNEKPSDGSLIITKYGKGNFVYTGLVFFRELPAGVPGAYRLFANILSLPKNN
ncbi:MAG: LmbE family protein, partial [Cytophagales bacterium]|nr:LmbE family protein [Cytophagales bacterium]